MTPEEIQLIEEAAGVIIPWVIQKLFDKKIINSEQKLFADGIVLSGELLSELRVEYSYPSGKNGQSEESAPTPSNIT